MDALHDAIYALEAAVEDVDRDLESASPPGADDYRDALEWLLAAARPLTSLRLGGDR
jgi:hypothetical protein